MTKIATEVRHTLNDGNKIPALAIGTVPPEDPSEVTEQIKVAVKAGFRHIDTAWYYGTEKYVGQALKELFEEGVIKREDIFITTKVWHSFHHSPEKSLNKSLSDLGIDYVDLLLQHWPVCSHGDENGLPSKPIDDNGNLMYDDDPVSGTKFIEFYNAIEDIKLDTNKVRSVGVSNYSTIKLKSLLPHVKKFVPVVNQIEYHPYLPQRDLEELCAQNDIIIEAYSPVGGTGAPVVKDPFVNELAQKYNVTTNEIVNAYHILQNRVSIPRSFNYDRIRNMTTLPDLTKEDLNNLYELGAKNPRRYTNDQWGYGLGFKWWDGDNLSQKYEDFKA